MRKELLLLGAFGMLTTATLCAQEFHLQPTPQEYITQKDSVDIPRIFKADEQQLYAQLNAKLKP